MNAILIPVGEEDRRPSGVPRNAPSHILVIPMSGGSRSPCDLHQRLLAPAHSGRGGCRSADCLRGVPSAGTLSISSLVLLLLFWVVGKAFHIDQLKGTHRVEEL